MSFPDLTNLRKRLELGNMTEKSDWSALQKRTYTTDYKVLLHEARYKIWAIGDRLLLNVGLQSCSGGRRSTWRESFL